MIQKNNKNELSINISTKGVEGNISQEDLSYCNECKYTIVNVKQNKHNSDIEGGICDAQLKTNNDK